MGNNKNLLSKSYVGIHRLAREKPKWLPIVKCAYKVALDFISKGYTPEFAGSWVLEKAKEEGVANWFPGLKILVSYGILKKTGTARGGRRTYYMFEDLEGAKRALQELGLIS